MGLSRRHFRIISTIFALLFLTATIVLLAASLTGDKLYKNGSNSRGFWRSCFNSTCQRRSEILRLGDDTLIIDFLFLLMIFASIFVVISTMTLNMALCKGSWELMGYTGATSSLAAAGLSLMYATILNVAYKKSRAVSMPDYGWSSYLMFVAAGTSPMAFVFTLLAFMFTRKPSAKENIQNENGNQETLTEHAKYLSDYKKEFDITNFSYMYDDDGNGTSEHLY